jgi:uncharacterized protein (DUF488 family)
MSPEFTLLQKCSEIGGFWFFFIDHNLDSIRIHEPIFYRKFGMTKLFTVGYEGASPEDFIATLVRAGVTRIIDIRQLPQSRRRGFSKNQLSALLSDANIEYQHLRQLGDPKHGRDAARAGRMEEFRQIFTAHLELADSMEALKIAKDLAEEKTSALLCYERDYKHCHRAIVANKMSVLYKFLPEHIGVVHGEARKQHGRAQDSSGFTRASI